VSYFSFSSWKLQFRSHESGTTVGLPASLLSEDTLIAILSSVVVRL